MWSESQNRKESIVLFIPQKFGIEEELCRYCWKCYEELGYRELANRNYEEVMSGQVGPLLASMLDRWSEDKTFLGHFSFLGSKFWFIPKWLESRTKRKKTRRRKSMALQAIPSPNLRKQFSGLTFTRTKT